MADVEAANRLLKGSDDERLAAARELARNPRHDASKFLNAALKRERVRWVRVALAEAIERCEALNEPSLAPAAGSSRDGEEQEDLRQTYADGRRDGMRQALHEITPLLGLARVAADGEFDIAEVGLQLERMRTVTAALRGLITASAVPKRQEFDFEPFLTAFRDSPPVECPAGVVATRGSAPFLVRGDRDLLGLAVQPLIANAIEAVLGAGGTPPPRGVMVSWGAELDAHWIAVIDEGPGPPSDSEHLFALGATDKADHIGFGLETARTAISSMGGTVTLEKNRRGGATAILRWPRPA